MTIREILRTGQLQTNVDKIQQYSAINIGFLINDGKEDETQLDVSHNILTKAGLDELEALFNSMTDEFNTRKDKVLYCVVVASASSYAELELMGY